jgi:hypothetical protein
MAELIQPILILQDARKYTLVIPKECESKQTATANGELQRLATPEPGLHTRCCHDCHVAEQGRVSKDVNRRSA